MDCAIHKNIQIYLQSLLDYNFGLNNAKAQVIHVFGGSGDLGGWQPNENNSVSVELPYGGKTVKWDFTFWLEDLRVPPEVFSDDGFFETVTIEEFQTTVTCLKDWQPESPLCLLQYALQLLKLYHLRQTEYLNSTEELARLKMEHEMVVNTCEPEAFEVAIHRSDRGLCMELTIQLPLDVEDLPLLQPSPNRLAKLTIEYKTFADTYVKLPLREDLEQILGKFPLPALTNKTTTMDYVQVIMSILQKRIEGVKDRLRKRLRLLSEIRTLVGEKLLYIESEFWTKISFLAEKGMQQQSVCLVDLSDGHPDAPPKLSLLAMPTAPSAWNSGNMAHEPERIIFEFKHQYNPKWDHKICAQRIINAFNKQVGIENDFDYNPTTSDV